MPATFVVLVYLVLKRNSLLVNKHLLADDHSVPESLGECGRLFAVPFAGDIISERVTRRREHRHKLGAETGHGGWLWGSVGTEVGLVEV
jgi:hypothetical protein